VNHIVRIRITTPERTVLEAEDIQHAILPAANGEVGILPGHIATVCRLTVGRIRVDPQEGEPVELATSGGFAEVLNDTITVLAETAERAEEIDLKRAEHARDEAQQALLHRGELVDDATAQAELSRALNRIRVASER
jgi:F-type H+-transporting ATPase subunit epsilon